MSSRILDETGLVVGWKSIKNYSMFVFGRSSDKRENPSLATLDTLARYVLGAPRSDEIQRQKSEHHLPYWFRYREMHRADRREGLRSRRTVLALVGLVGIAALVGFILLRQSPRASTDRFQDDFRSVEQDTLASNGWRVAGMDPDFWAQRGILPGTLTLYTLRGDNWPDSGAPSNIRNLVYRRIPCSCFAVELHLVRFLPRRNWQQAGIILFGDTAFTKEAVRLSLAYNDYSGGFPSEPEVLVQAITTKGEGYEKPEEIVHKTLFRLARDTEGLVAGNLQNSALRMELNGNKLRFLYAAGAAENAAFNELANRELNFQPAYVGVFALKGFVGDTAVVPVHVSLFSLSCTSCDR